MRKVLLAVLFFSLLPSAPAEATHCIYQGRNAFGSYAISYYFCPPHGALASVPPVAPGYAPPRARVPGTPRSLLELAHTTAERHGVNPKLVEAVITVESGWNPWVVSPKGAKGLMQLMPQTAARLGVRDPFDPYENIVGGVRHLRELLDEFGDLRLALAAYNAGAEAVHSYGGIPPFPETQAYVPKVLSLLR